MPSWRKVIVSGSDANLNSLNVNTSVTSSNLLVLSDTQLSGSTSISGSLSVNDYTLPTSDGTLNQIIFTDGQGNLEFDFLRTLYEEVKNVSSTTLAKGTPVYVSSSTGNTNNVLPASASSGDTMPAVFVLGEELAPDQEGSGIILGFINGVNTSLFNEGDIVYVGPNGGYTNIKPTGSNLIQPLGLVTKVDATNGSGIVFNAGVFNDVPNLLNGQVFYGENNTSVSKPLGDIFTGNFFNYSGSFTGSLQGTATTASYALLAKELEGGAPSSFPFTGSATISGSLIVDGPITNTGGIVSPILIQPKTITGKVELPESSSGIIFGDTNLSSSISVPASSKVYYFDIDSVAFTSSLVASSSYAFYSVSGSHSIFSDNAFSSSYALNSTTSSYALTASYALNAGGGEGSGFPFSGSAVITGSLSADQYIKTPVFVNDRNLKTAFTSPSASDSFAVEVINISDTLTITDDTTFSVFGEFDNFVKKGGNNTFVGNQVFSEGFTSNGQSAFSGSLALTGSVAGNVTSLSLVSNTASIDLSKGNFFTITLQSGSNYIDVLNPKPGITANVLVSTVSNATASFSNNVKQETGSFYSPTDATGEDLITLISFSTENVYVLSVNQLV